MNDDDDYVNVENNMEFSNENITVKDVIEFDIRFLNDKIEITELPSPVEKRYQLADIITHSSLCTVINSTTNIIKKTYPLLQDMNVVEYNSYMNSLVIPKNIKTYFIENKELISKKTAEEMTSTAFLNCIFN